MPARIGSHGGISLTGWGCVYCVGVVSDNLDGFQRTGLNKLKWVIRLRINIDAKYPKAGTVVSHCCAACPAEQIKE